MDDAEGRPYDDILPYSLVFSPDSKRVAYIAKSGSDSRVVADNQEGDAYESILDGSVTISPNSQRLAYIVRTKSGSNVVIDGKEEKRFERIKYQEVSGGQCIPVIPPASSLVFSPDSRRLAYVVEVDGKSRVIVDGNEGHSFDEILPFRPVFSADSKQLSYIARAGEFLFKVTNGKEEEIPSISNFDKNTLVFSPDGKRFAYVRMKSPNRYAPVIDGQELEPAEMIDGKIVFSPDSKRVAYIASNLTLRRLYVDGQAVSEPAHVHHVMSPVFSRDSKHVAYLIKVGNEHAVVVNGRELYHHEFIWNEPVFSPDGRHLAYWVCEKNTDGVLILDGKELRRYSLTNNYLLHDIVFSPDSKRIATWVGLFNKGAIMLVNSTEGNAYTCWLPPLGAAVFDSPTRIHYLAGHGDTIYLVEETLRW